MINFIKRHLLAITFIISVAIILTSGIIYTSNWRYNQEMIVKFEKTFEQKVPMSDEEKEKIENTIRIKLSTLKIKAYGTSILSNTANTADKIVDIEKIPGVNLNSLENNKTNSQKEYEEAIKTADYFGYSFPENKTLKQNTWSLLKSIF